MDEAKRQNAIGTVVTLMWHAVRPIEDEPVTFKEGVCGKLTDEEWNDLITPGTAVHARWESQVDIIAGFLGQLKAATVPVLWRPYHEMNGDWFWWGYRTGPRGYAALWRQLYERLVGHYGLNNLIWVWNANAPRGTVLPHADCFPGHDYVDVLATDVYSADFKQSHHDDLVALAEGKPVALGEVGEVPTPDILDRQPQWAWFMVWSGLLTKSNTPEQIRAIYNYPRTLNFPGHVNWESLKGSK
jgi:mannan endo-1,4-beta-mannosidase